MQSILLRPQESRTKVLLALFCNFSLNMKQLLMIVLPNIVKELTGKDIESFVIYHLIPYRFSIGIREVRVSECRVSSLMLIGFDVIGKILGNVSVEEHSEYILLEIPAIHVAAQMVGDIPEHAMELCAFRFFLIINSHGSNLIVARSSLCGVMT